MSEQKSFSVAGTGVSEETLRAIMRKVEGEECSLRMYGKDYVILEYEVFRQLWQVVSRQLSAGELVSQPTVEDPLRDTYQAALESWDSVGSPEDANLYE